ncbi:hypothetical protein J8281_18560 [Aquimarina sp. U1-2]|uniref:hypothetical protein n=1 Tax=Aquimarina sp. U1-2 TaxID=2823141 RepID=UPI001AECC15F|nr:hypothetical protein [Aquimarina sp. U1-2]MBP2834206.1 hypothetical protein [Aquimarina sp. U1-2]
MKYKLSFTITIVSVFCYTGLLAQDQQSKLNEKITVNRDVVVRLNTSHTNVIFETWNKNTVEINAYLEGDLTNDTSKHILDSWQVNVVGDSNEITINSAAGNLWRRDVTASNIKVTKDNLEDLRRLSPLIANMLSPLIKNIEKNPMPNTLTQNRSNVNYGAANSNKGEEKYVEQWENQIREKFSDDLEKSKQKWALQLQEEHSNIVAGQMEIRLETSWGAQYEKQMNTWAAQLTKDINNQQKGVANVTFYQYRSNNNKTTSHKVSKVIKVYMPKAAQLKLNIRHGDVQLAERSTNVIASLSHTKLSAKVIDGDQTFIKASYSPVFVRQWDDGKLVVNYVKNCRIQTANNLLVNSDSSNIYIQQLNQNGAISGSFGVITIENLGASFSTLDLVVRNSDFHLKLPETALNLSYSGAQSLISLPKTMQISSRRNFGNVFINGFQKTRSTDKMITINAKYSEVVLSK